MSSFLKCPARVVTKTKRYPCIHKSTSKHSSRMHTARLPTMRASVATKCQYWWGRGSSSEQVWTGLWWGIPVKCILPACQPYVPWWPPNVSTGWGEGAGGPQVNEFEQVSGDSHQISLAGELASEVPCPTSGGGQGQAWGVSGPCLEGGWAWARGIPQTAWQRDWYRDRERKKDQWV